MKNLKRFSSIPVIAVISIIGFVYYITVFVFIETWVGLQSSAGLLNALLFTIMGFLCLLSFSACVLTDPGRVSSSYIPDVEESAASDQESRKNRMQSSHCDKCFTYKPPRTHHCRVCRRCVLKMDHHCTWVNNCIGFRNYKAFFILIFYATLACIYSTVIIIACAFEKDQGLKRSDLLKIFHVACGAVMIGLSSIIGSLLGWHVYLVAHNMTTIEYHEVKRATWLAQKSGQSYQHPFDISFYQNITSVLGPNMLKWLCPTAISHLKDGTGFPTLRERL